MTAAGPAHPGRDHGGALLGVRRRHQRDDVAVVLTHERRLAHGRMGRDHQGPAGRLRVTPRDEDGVRRTGVEPLAAGAGLPYGGVTAAADEVGDEVGAHPLLGVGGGPLEQQQERGHHGGALDRAPVGVVEVLDPADHEEAQCSGPP